MMQLIDIFVPKGDGLGWTLDFSNPFSWVVLAALMLTIYLSIKPQIKELFILLRGYFGKRK
jgi:hypothetical protein